MQSTAKAYIDPLPSVVVDRVFDAPRDLMFKLWTEPAHIARWWGPYHFTVPHASFDTHAGGRLRIDFRSPDGFTFPNYGEVREVAPPDRLVFTAEYREGDRLMVVSLVTVTFLAEGDKTRLKIVADVTFAEPEAANSLAGMEEGWNQQVDKLELQAVVARLGDYKLAVTAPERVPTILMARTFDAPRALVWKCLTEKDRFSRWWGPRGTINTITDFDIRVGGKWRVVQKDREGHEWIFFGTYREIRAPERLVNSFAMENLFEGKEVIDTYILEDVEGRTRYTSISTFEAFDDRAGMLGAGMETGAAETLDKLAEEVAALAREQGK